MCDGVRGAGAAHAAMPAKARRSARFGTMELGLERRMREVISRGALPSLRQGRELSLAEEPPGEADAPRGLLLLVQTIRCADRRVSGEICDDEARTSEARV